jgi:hypothetical protein
MMRVEVHILGATVVLTAQLLKWRRGGVDVAYDGLTLRERSR